MEIQRLTAVNQLYYEDMLQLYQDAFPVEERRPVEKLNELVENKKSFVANALVHDGQFAGLLNYWEFDSFVYLEHLAMLPQLRGQNLGGMLLETLKKDIHLPLVLEAERPETEIAARRAAFYQRHGFHVVDKDYMQPPYRAGEDEFPLWLFSTDEHFPLENVRLIKQEVYGVFAHSRS